MMGSCQISLCTNNTSLTKAGKGQGRAPGQASDYTLWAPNPLDSCTHDQAFYQDFGHPNQFGPLARTGQVFPPPHLPPSCWPGQ